MRVGIFGDIKHQPRWCWPSTRWQYQASTLVAMSKICIHGNDKHQHWWWWQALILLIETLNPPSWRNLSIRICYKHVKFRGHHMVSNYIFNAQFRLIWTWIKPSLISLASSNQNAHFSYNFTKDGVSMISRSTPWGLLWTQRCFKFSKFASKNVIDQMIILIIYQG